MAPPVADAKITLTYPLYAADFDPQNSSFLLVGGGGGEGRSGVGNKITLLNASRKQELSEVVDIDLSRDEDSVTSLVYSQSTESWATAFAGINSSAADQNAGKNEHLRSFLLEYPPRRRTHTDDAPLEKEELTGYKGETKALGRASFFTPSTAIRKETFQRVLRLSEKKKDNGPRLGAVATGLAPEGEIVLFAADSSRPGTNDIRRRINLGEREEAADVDIIRLEGSGEEQKSTFRVVYCTDYEVYVTDVQYEKEERSTEPQRIHGIPYLDAATSQGRPKFRCVRFLTPSLLILLQNQPNGKGSELLLLEISGIVTLRKSLHKKIKSAIALSVALLPASNRSQKAQHAIAVAGADTSITVLTLDRPLYAPYGPLKFQPHTFLPSAHPTSITSLTFSAFTPPSTPWTSTPPQYLKLASTSIANTCVVHTLPLTPHPNPPPKEEPAHYLLNTSTRSNLAQNTFSVLVALLAIALGSFLLQAFTEIRGGTPEYLGAKGWLSERVYGWIARPYMFEDVVPIVAREQLSVASEVVETPWSKASEAVETPLGVASEAVETPLHAVASAALKAQAKLGLRDLLARRNIGSDTSDNANDGTDIIVRHSPSEGRETALSAELRDPHQVIEGEHEAKRWEEMEEHEREGWKKRLLDAGEWTLEEGESVLKGVFFSGLAITVGGLVRGG